MARITIDLSKGVFEIEGSEDFVEKRFTEFQPQLTAAMQQPRLEMQQDSQSPSSKQSKPTRTKSKQRAKRTEAPAVFQGLDMIPIKLSGGVMYSKLKYPQDRLIWSLALAKELEIEGLESSDIVWLTDKSGVGIPSSQVTIHYQRARKKGFVNQSTITNKMHITNEGIEHLNSLLSQQEAP